MFVEVYRRKTILRRLLGKIGAWLLCLAAGDRIIVHVDGKGVFVRR